jgi:serine protease Do
MRGGKRLTIPVVVGQRPSEAELLKRSGANSDEQMVEPDAPVTQGSKTLGLSLQPLSPAIARTLNMPVAVKGVVITNVDSSSDASDKGLRRGDVIMSINRQDVTTPAQVLAGVEAAKRSGRTSVLLLVKRGSAPEAFVGISLTDK